MGNPVILFQDLLTDPSKYEEGVSELLQSLMGGKRKIADLNLGESQLLDRAVIDFASAKKPAQPTRPILTKALPPKEEEEEPPPTVDGIKPFWWVQ